MLRYIQKGGRAHHIIYFLPHIGTLTLIIPGQQSHHSGDDADEVEHGVGHLALEDPVRVGWRVTGDADGAVGQRHDEVQRHTAQHDYPMNQRLQDRCTMQEQAIMTNPEKNSTK